LSRVLKTFRAEEDLHEIWAYIAEDNPAAADKLIGEFDRAFRLLADHPKMGRERPELLPGIRSLPVGNYAIFFVEEQAEGVKIVRVLHGARNLESLEFNPQAEGH
jgi:toxin ParE1/3/4